MTTKNIAAKFRSSLTFVRETRLLSLACLISLPAMLAGFFLCASPANAQSHAQLQDRHAQLQDKHTPLQEKYTTRLAQAHDSIFADSTTVASSGVRLPFPLTYNPETVRRAFTLGDSVSDFEQSLLQRYIDRPYQVRGTMADLKHYLAPSTRKDKGHDGTPLKASPDLVEQTPQPALTPNGLPVDMIILHPNFWNYHGEYALQFMQNYVSGNWYKGGESNYSALGAITLEANYNNKQKVKWENKLELKFGLASTRSDSLHSYKTTDDLFRVTSKLGLQATKKWYYTLQLLAYSQFANSYKSNNPDRLSSFLAPANVNVSIGMDYSVDWLKHRLKGSFHLAPLAYNMKYARLLELSERLGIDAGKHFLHDFGSEFTVDLTWQLLEQVKWKTRLYGYTTYERTELEWENTISLQVNRFISAQLFFYPRFDDGVAHDDHHGYWQFKEYASIGFAYSF